LKVYLAGVAPGARVKAELKRVGARRLFSYFYIEKRPDASHKGEWEELVGEKKK